MKEATGELNMTVVTVVAIGVILAFFYVFIWPSIKTGMALNTACNAAGTGDYDMTTDDGIIHCEGGSCTYKDANGKENTKACAG